MKFQYRPQPYALENELTAAVPASGRKRFSKAHPGTMDRQNPQSLFLNVFPYSLVAPIPLVSAANIYKYRFLAESPCADGILPLNHRNHTARLSRNDPWLWKCAIFSRTMLFGIPLTPLCHPTVCMRWPQRNFKPLPSDFVAGTAVYHPSAGVLLFMSMRLALLAR